MLRSEWREIISQSNAIIVKETGYHYKPFKKRIYDLLKNPKMIFRPIALYVFVLKGK